MSLNPGLLLALVRMPWRRYSKGSAAAREARSGELGRNAVNFETVLFDVAGDGVATVTLNRPDRLNAFTRRTLEELRAIWTEVRENTDIRAVVVRAAGERAFCSGIDVSEPYRRPGETSRPFDLDDPGEYIGPKQNRIWKPVICAVQGMCAGGGFYFLNEADIILCSEEATFFDPHVTFGLVAAVEPVGALARMPLAEVLRMSLMGNTERIGAATALRISLVTEVVPKDQLWSRAHEIAASIARRHPVAVQGSVRAVWEALSLPHREAVSNAFKYTQIGNPISSAEVERAAVAKEPWTLR